MSASPIPKNLYPHTSRRGELNRFLFHPNDLRFLAIFVSKNPVAHSTCHFAIFLLKLCHDFCYIRLQPALRRPARSSESNHQGSKGSVVRGSPDPAPVLDRRSPSATNCTRHKTTNPFTASSNCEQMSPFNSQIVPNSFAFPRIHEYWIAQFVPARRVQILNHPLPHDLRKPVSRIPNPNNRKSPTAARFLGHSPGARIQNGQTPIRSQHTSCSRRKPIACFGQF
jgi:hypothetical protein